METNEIKRSDFSIQRIMGAIFTPDFSIGSTSSLVDFFQKSSGYLFDGDLFSAPIPQNAPAEIPRIIMRSKDSVWRLEISLQRTTLVFEQDIEMSHVLPSLDDFADNTGNLFQSFKDNKDIRIDRLAFVVERSYEMEYPGQFIANRFCKKEYLDAPFNNVTNFELHSLKTYPWDAFKVNSWVRIKSAVLSKKGNIPVLLMVNDLNTIVDTEGLLDYSVDDIMSFFISAHSEVENIVDIYF